MAQITLTISDALAPRVIAGFCGLHNYQVSVRDPKNPEGSMIPNPETKMEFIKRILLGKIKRDVLEYEGNEAQRQALSMGQKDIIL